MRSTNPEWQDEIDALVLDCYDGNGTGPVGHANALTRCLDLLADAEQAHRPWVRDVYSEAMRLGLADMLKRRHRDLGGQLIYQDRTGRMVARDRVQGIQIPDPETGSLMWTQMDFHEMTVEQHEAKIREAQLQMQEARVNRDLHMTAVEILTEARVRTLAEIDPDVLASRFAPAIEAAS